MQCDAGCGVSILLPVNVISKKAYIARWTRRLGTAPIVIKSFDTFLDEYTFVLFHLCIFTYLVMFDVSCDLI